MKNTTRLTRAALVAALYIAITLLFQPISGFSGQFQLRISEALTLLPVLMEEAVPGLFVGCLLANLLGGGTLLDILFGSLATLAAAVWTRKLQGTPVMAALPPVLVNMLVVGTVLAFTLKLPWLPSVLWVGLGQAAACYGLGLPLVLLILKRKPPIQDTYLKKIK